MPENSTPSAFSNLIQIFLEQEREQEEECAEHIARVKQLTSENAQLRAELERFKRENAELMIDLRSANNMDARN